MTGAATEDEAREDRTWSVSLQVHVWTTVTVRAADVEDAVERAADDVRARFGEDVFINEDSTEVG